MKGCHLELLSVRPIVLLTIMPSKSLIHGPHELEILQASLASLDVLFEISHFAVRQSAIDEIVDHAPPFRAGREFGAWIH